MNKNSRKRCINLWACYPLSNFCLAPWLKKWRKDCNQKMPSKPTFQGPNLYVCICVSTDSSLVVWYVLNFYWFCQFKFYWEVGADMRKVKILPQTGFWGSEFPQNSVICDHLKNIRYISIVLIITYLKAKLVLISFSTPSTHSPTHPCRKL